MRVPTKPASFLHLDSLFLAGLLVLIALLTLASVSRAASTAPLAADPSLPGLAAALQRRIDEIQAPPGRGHNLHEERRLENALKKLGNYAGLLGSYSGLEPQDQEGARQDLQTLTTVAVLIGKSKTSDSGILFQVAAVRNTIDSFGLEARQVALATRALLVSEARKGTLTALVDKGDVLRAEGLSRWQGDFGAGARQLVQASFHQHQAVEYGAKQRWIEANENPVDVIPMDVVPMTPTPTAQEPFEVEAQVVLNTPVPELTIAVRAISMDQMASARSGETPMPHQVTLGVETFLDVQPGEPLPLTVEVPAFADEAVVKKLHGQSSTTYTVCDIDGNIAVATLLDRHFSGADVVVVFERNEGGFNNWGETARLVSPDPLGPGGFGAAIAISGDTIVVGAPFHGTSGAAMVFERRGATWDITAILTPSDLTFLDRFGAAVDISGDRIVVGAPGHRTDSRCGGAGTAYVFERNQGGPEAWGQSADFGHGLSEFFACDFAVGELGTSVAIDGNLILVGDSGHPQAFVFELVSGSWGPIETVLYLDPSPLFETGFGAAVAVSGQTLIVGAPRYDFPGKQDAGAVFIYNRGDLHPFEFPPTPEAQINVPSPMPFDNFGSAVAFSDAEDLASQMLVVGSPGHDPRDIVDAGSAYIFVRGHAPGCPPVPQDGGWGLLARRASDVPTTSGRFGSAVAVSSARVVDEVVDGQVLERTVSPTSIAVVEPGLGTPAAPGLGTHVFTGMDPVMAGEYLLAIEVDPFDRVLELNGDGSEQNNLHVAETPVTFCVPALDQLNLTVESVQLVPIDDVTNTGFICAEIAGEERRQLTSAGLNVTLKMTGAFDGPLSGATLSTNLQFKSEELSSEGKIWDPASGAYVSNFPLPNMVSGDTVSLSLDVDYPVPLELVADNYDVNVSVSIVAPLGVTDVNPDDNTATQEGQDYTVLQFAECSFEEMYEKQMGNGEFNVTAEFMGSLALASSLDEIPGHGLFEETEAEYGAIGSLEAKADLTLFGTNLGHVVRMRALIERDPVYRYNPVQFPFCPPDGYGFIGFDLELLGQTIYSIGPYDTIDLFTVDFDDLPTGFSVLDDPTTSDPNDSAGFIWEKTFDAFCLVEGEEVEEDEGDEEECPSLFEFEKTFYPGGFPITVKAEATGTVGLDLTLEVSNRLKFDIEPKIEFTTSVAGAVGNCDFTCVGAEGELTLVKDTFSITSALGLTVTTMGTDEDLCGRVVPTAQSFGAGACFSVQNEITLLGGELKAFAIYPWIDWCEACPFFCFWYPCAIYQRQTEIPIFEWTGFVLTQELLDASADACCVPVLGAINCNNSGLCR